MTLLAEVQAAHRAAVARMVQLQYPDGCWEGECQWNVMLISQYVITCRIVGRPIPPDDARLMERHFDITRTPEGGWPWHPEGETSVFCTTLAYIALRLLGRDADEAARLWLLRQPGAVNSIPTWGRMWLCMLGMGDYSTVNPFPPETFLLPRWAPVHPDRLNCQTRMVYQALAYLYGCRFTADLGDLGRRLQQELAISLSHRAPLSRDAYLKPTRLMTAIHGLLHLYDRVHLSGLRRRALARCYQRVVYEQETTACQGLGPAPSLLSCLVLYHHDPHDPLLQASLDGLDYWRWSDQDGGLRYAGNRTHVWDTAFAVSALLEHHPEQPILNACHFLQRQQITQDLPDPATWARDSVIGGWCLSASEHRWPVSDCTAEALVAIIETHRLSAAPVEPLTTGQRDDAVRFLLDRQNSDGSFGAFERRRGPLWLERLNPSEMFSDCMVEQSYVECTGSALAAFSLPDLHASQQLRAPTTRAIRRAVSFLRHAQRADGSFEGAWGINFTYATWFATRGMLSAGVSRTDPCLTRAAEWLIQKQNSDGGWGEHHSSCHLGTYVSYDSQPTMTSWALLALIEIMGIQCVPVMRGVQWLCQAQRPTGSWPDTSVNGVFYRTGILNYRLYHSYFPVWALGRYLGSGSVRRTGVQSSPGSSQS